MFGLSIPHLILLLVVVAMLFGTKKLRNVGTDLGEAVRGFKKGMAGDDPAPQIKDEAAKKPEEPKT